MQDLLPETGDNTTEVTPTTTATASSPMPAGRRRAYLAVLAVALVTFVLIAPTLTWLEFSGGAENLTVATALEMRREHRWLTPTLNGEPRVAKPPLTAWIAAGVAGNDALGGMSSPDAAVRERAEKTLAWQIRWPFLLSSFLMLLAAAELGRVLGDGDWRIGAIAAGACASNIFFLRHGRMATTDVQLALWVAVTNVFLAHAVMRGRWWTGAIGAGAALGLAFMSKGPVAFVQSIAPVAVFLLWDTFIPRRSGVRDGLNVEAPSDSRPAQPAGMRFAQFLLAVGIFCLVALPWYAIVAIKNPDVWSRWQIEVTRKGATDLPPGNWYAYISLFAFIAPWTAFLIAGMAVIVRDVFFSPPLGTDLFPSPGAPVSPSPGAPGKRGGEGWAQGPSSVNPAPVSPHPHPALSRSTGRGEREGDRRGMLLALLMLIIPIVIMSFFRDRKERYLLPMIVPASVVIARAVVEHVRTRHLRHAADLAVVAIHWTTLLFIAIGLPLAGVMSLKRLDGGPWFSPALAAIAAALGVAIVVGGMVAHRKCPGRAIAGATLLLMLGMQLLFMHGYRASREGLSEMKPLAMMIRERAPEARLFSTGSKIQRAPSDLSIYLNRPVVWVDNASEIPSSARPAVIVIRQRKGESPPSPPPGGSVIGKTARDEGWWYAFEMP